MTRDFVGYGAEPPHAQWPGDARIAVNFVINFEEGSELSYPAGDGVSEGGLTEMLGADLGVTGRDLGAESMFEYGARVGFWRLHRIFTRFALPVTIFGCARAFEANPPAAAAIVSAGWDICSHGYRWTNHPGLPEEEERQQIAAAGGFASKALAQPKIVTGTAKRLKIRCSRQKPTRAPYSNMLSAARSRPVTPRSAPSISVNPPSETPSPAG